MTVTDDDGGQGGASTTQHVNNVDPEVEVNALDPVAVDEVFTLSGFFNDPGVHAASAAYPPETHTIAIDWGDGNTTTLNAADLGYDVAAPGTVFTADHTYDDIGEFTVQYYRIQVTVTDDDTGADTATDADGQPGIPIAVYTDPDLDTDSNNDGGIDPDNSPMGTDDPDEELPPGRVVGVNDDDDKNDRVRDFDLAPIYTVEDDLAQVNLSRATQNVPDNSGWTLSLEAPPSNFKVWVPGPFGAGGLMDEMALDGNANLWDVKDPNLPSVVWVEARAVGSTLLSLVLRKDGQERSRDPIALTFVQLDLDTDSDNSGAVDRTLAEDADERYDPGAILFYNTDDDNGNGAADRTDPAPFVDVNGTPVDDDNLEAANLSLSSNIISSLTGFTLELSPTTAIDTWLTRDKQSLPLTYTIGTDTIPATIFVEGYDYGEAMLDVTLKSPAGLEIHRDRLQFLVTRIDLRGFRPNTAHFAAFEIPFAEEMNPGVGIRRNGDDDDGDGTPDRLDIDMDSENDLVKLDVFNGFPELPEFQDTRLQITRSNTNLNVWSGPLKSTSLSEPLLGANTGNAAVLEDTAQTSDLYVEWVNMNLAATTASLELSLWDDVHNNKVFSDTIAFHPFTSVVVVLGGETEVPADPPNPGYGTFQMAIDIYREDGYDVHMYNEDAVATSGAGAAYDELVNAIQNRGVTDVAIMGYSHGGGSTHDLAWRLEQNTIPGSGISDITLPFTIPFTSYVDAVWQVTGAEETRRPPLSLFHTNQYETNSAINGGPTGGDDDIDRSYLGVTHLTIDGNATVLDFVKTRLRQKVQR
ncbi:MAG: PKD domain-containing protein [Planctomycetes bacterium]|nr:PKD domain-containing protein [Planctomycetota bacterium]